MVGGMCRRRWLEECVDFDAGGDAGLCEGDDRGEGWNKGKAARAAYVRASNMERGLYEKFGWKVQGTFSLDLTDCQQPNEAGVKREVIYQNWNLIREPFGEGEEGL